MIGRVTTIGLGQDPIALQHHLVIGITFDRHNGQVVHCRNVRGIGREHHRIGPCAQVNDLHALDDGVIQRREVQGSFVVHQKGVVARTTIDLQIGGVVHKHVITCITAQDVSATSTIDRVIAIKTAQHVALCGTGDDRVGIGIGNFRGDGNAGLHVQGQGVRTIHQGAQLVAVSCAAIGPARTGQVNDVTGVTYHCQGPPQIGKRSAVHYQ